MWIFRNIHLILTVINKNFNFFLNATLLNSYFNSLFGLTKLFFNNGLRPILKTLVTKWKPLLGLNFTKGLQYWILSSGNTFIENKSSFSLVNYPQVGRNLVENQYYTNMTLSNISLHNKYYRTVLVKFMSLILSNWQLWNKHYTISFKFLVGTKDLHLLRYYNSYFCKIYNF